MIHKQINIFLILHIFIFFLFSCSNKTLNKTDTKPLPSSQKELLVLLNDTTLEKESRFALTNQIALNYLKADRQTDLILFLTSYVKDHPDDMYNAYWLLMTAYTYQQNNSDAVAKLYYERIIRNYDDLMVEGESIHFICLQNLVKIATSSENRIEYFNQLITRFPEKVSKTELYVRLAQEYEALGNWNQVIKSYSLFLAQDDASTIQIAGIPDAYETARNLINFNNSPKDWTFETLDELENAVKSAISHYQYTKLDTYKTKVNFFAMSWRQDAEDKNAQETFSMRDYGWGNRIHFNAELDESSTPNEAYLRTWGWSRYLNVWYLYFRKVNFPIDPEIHGHWEWAGIYFGDKL
ncbi:MAG: tetratricopeptide repeat protein [Treponema sp. CETP13]|nr:MAG: tetratricopeptide repeat protein [Treponema sp. CETP13]